MPSAKFTRAKTVKCITCGCLFTPVTYQKDRNKIQHSPGRTTCSRDCYIGRLRAAKIRDEKERFWEKVEIKSPNECWPWMASRSKFGHGSFGRTSGGTKVASRCAYEFTNGPAPRNLEVRHKCDNPWCCNPSHLEIGTHAENMRDMAIRGRANPSQETIEKIRTSQIGREFTEEHRKKLSDAKSGKPSPRAQSVIVRGISYKSKIEAMKTLRISRKTLLKVISEGDCE